MGCYIHSKEAARPPVPPHATKYLQDSPSEFGKAVSGLIAETPRQYGQVMKENFLQVQRCTRYAKVQKLLLSEQFPSRLVKGATSLPSNTPMCMGPSCFVLPQTMVGTFAVEVSTKISSTPWR